MRTFIYFLALVVFASIIAIARKNYFPSTSKATQIIIFILETLVVTVVLFFYVKGRNNLKKE